MGKDYLNILVFEQATFGTRCLRIRKETFKILVYLLAFFQLSVVFFFCDYIQVKKRQLGLNQLQQESQIRKVQIQLFSTQIKEVEKKLSKLKVIDGRIRTIANLDRNEETHSFIGMGGSSPPEIPVKSKEAREGK